MPNATRVAPGVVNTELAIASDGPETMPFARSWSDLPSAAGKAAGVGVEAPRAESWIPPSFGTLRTGSVGVGEAFLLPPPQPASRTRTETSGAITRYMAE